MLVVRNDCLQLVSNHMYTVPKRIATSQSWVSQMPMGCLWSVLQYLLQKRWKRFWCLGLILLQIRLETKTILPDLLEGDRRRCPMWPNCNFNAGHHLPSTFCCFSESRSITAELLVQMLNTTEKLEFSTKLTESHPSLVSLLDDHGSRFDLLFLQYINTAATKWNACICFPYGTSYWQVRDSPEQNGLFKWHSKMQKRLTYPKWKVPPCCVCCWKGWYC